jgi:hypothetical protein
MPYIAISEGQKDAMEASPRAASRSLVVIPIELQVRNKEISEHEHDALEPLITSGRSPLRERAC